MNHRIIRILIGVVIVATVVGGAIYFEWPRMPRHEQTSSSATVPPTSTVDLAYKATTSVLESLPRPTLGASNAEAAPIITWTPGSVSEGVARGHSKVLPISFTASENVSDVVAHVVPELQPFVRVSPVSFGSILKGQGVHISLTISASNNFLFGTFEGTIQLTSAADPSRTFARPLPVTVVVGMDTPTVRPVIISAQTPVPVTVEIRIPDPALISDRVTLERLDSRGEVVSVLGNLHDDGRNGDITAGDRVFSTQATYHMPKMNGLAVVQQLKADATIRHIPIIA